MCKALNGLLLIYILIHPLPYKTSRSLRSSRAGLLCFPTIGTNKVKLCVDCIFNTFVLIYQLQEINNLKCLNPFLFVFFLPHLCRFQAQGVSWEVGHRYNG